jgi:diguanylate cyclase (GGDEF)-like protein
MKKHPYIAQILQGVLLLILISLLIFSVAIFRQIRISSQIIEYSGIIRGSSQQAINMMLTGQSPDSQIQYIDRLYNALQSGSSSLTLPDSSYRTDLMKQREAWDSLKHKMEKQSNKTSRKAAGGIADANGKYYTLCDRTIAAVQSYSQGMMNTMRRLECSIMVVLAFLATITAQRSLAAARQLRRISLIEQEAYADPLTGTGSRQFYERFIKDISSSDSYCIIFIDIDNLKYVNDNLGHDAGDQYIRKTAAVIRSQFRSTDVMFRLGGDEFVLYVKGCTEEIARRQIERARNIIKGDVSQGYAGSFSYGISYVGKNSGKTFRYAAAEADRKMYEFKKQHKMNRNE